MGTREGGEEEPAIKTRGKQASRDEKGRGEEPAMKTRGKQASKQASRDREMRRGRRGVCKED